MSAGAPPSSQFSKDVEGGSAKDDGCAEIDVDGKKHDDTDDGYDDTNRLNRLPAFRGLLSDNWVTLVHRPSPYRWQNVPQSTVAPGDGGEPGKSVGEMGAEATIGSDDMARVEFPAE